uniref:Uncharacterized protein n=1 Tax=Pseudonaja textilis TaxID=8673 RepID=A0A670YE88_PSETE
MASVFQTVGSSIGWRSHQILSDFEESPVPDRFKKRSSVNMNSVRMTLRKRMPLKEVKMNFDENPTWENLEAKEKSSNLRMLTKTDHITIVFDLGGGQGGRGQLNITVGCLWWPEHSTSENGLLSSVLGRNGLLQPSASKNSL